MENGLNQYERDHHCTSGKQRGQFQFQMPKHQDDILAYIPSIRHLVWLFALHATICTLDVEAAMSFCSTFVSSPEPKAHR